jgi:hypothetical protein
MTNEQKKTLESAIAEFPETFRLRHFPGAVFRIDQNASYIASDGTVMLYTYIQRGRRWEAFAKGTIGELASQVVR